MIHDDHTAMQLPLVEGGSHPRVVDHTVSIHDAPDLIRQQEDDECDGKAVFPRQTANK